MDFDLVVVGAGSSGAPIAARASEDASQRVLLLEAGPDYMGPLPEDLRDGRKNSTRAHDWRFVFQPTREQTGDKPLPRGKVVGGSSAVNTCIALRGEPEDYDEWAAIAGPEWRWSECLPFLRKLEDDRDIPSELHGQGGPIPIRRARADELVPWQRAFLGACDALGFPRCDDHNAPGTTGSGPHPMNKIDGVRQSTAMGYLAPARGRENLVVRARTLVRRVLVDGARRVTGLEVETDGRVETIACRRVVLAAGAIQSPAILVRSGIGPRAVLERLGLPVHRDAPGVGARLLDHPGALFAMVAREKVATWDDPMIQTVLRYTAEGSADRNDMALQPLSFLQLDPGMPLLLGIAAVVQKPRGHGRLELTSADPHAQPAILPELAADAYDRRRLAEGLWLAKRFAELPMIRELSYGIIWPSPAEHASVEALEAWLPHACGSGYHPCGTAPMGPERDPASVVDAHGRVHGVEGLFVGDASIMPTIPRANTNLSAILIGERLGAWARDRVI